MLRLFLLLIFSILSGNLIAQIPETNPRRESVSNWYFGDSLAIKFINNNVNNLIGFKDWTYEGTSIISDDFGNVFMYSNGLRLYDSSHSKLTEKLKGGWSSSQQIIMHKQDSFIHIFTTAPSFGVSLDGFNYSLYNLNSKIFEILNIKKIENVGEKQNSINHQNNNFVWNVCHSQIGSIFYFFLIKNEEILCCPKIQKIGSIYTDHYPSQGLLKFSSNGKICVNANWNLQNFELYKTDLENGLFYNCIKFPFFYPYGVEFSPSTNYLFIVDRGKHLMKYKIESFDSASISQSLDTVYKLIDEKFGQLQLSIDNKIYVSNYKDSFLSSISNLDSQISFFTYKDHYLNGTCQGGLPNFNASYFYTPSIDFAYTEDCENHIYQFEGRDTFDAEGYKWIYKKGNQTDSLLTKHGQYQFIDTGKWQVSHIAWNANRADTVTKTLTLYPKWQKNILGNDTFYCQGKQPNLVLKAPPQMHCVHWQGEEPNLDEDLGPIVDYNHFHVDSLVIDTAGIYTVKLTNKTFCQLWDTIKVEEKPTPEKPIISFATGELASTIIAKTYTWYVNDSFYVSTSNRSILPNRNGYYQLVLTSDFGCQSEKSDSFFVDLESIAPLNSNNLFKVYPNPNKGSFSLQVTKPGIYQVEITDAIGKQVYKAQERITTTKELKLQLSQGNYLVTITDTNGNRNTRQFKVE